MNTRPQSSTQTTSSSVGNRLRRTLLCLGVAAASLASLPAAAQMTTRDLARQVLPSVATVYAYDAKGAVQGAGSAFVVRADGLLVTNSHVIEGAESAGVVFTNGRKARVVGVVAADPDMDYALLRVEAVALTPVKLASTSEPEIGERVVAIGAPHGLTGTVSEGIVSQLRQQEASTETPVERLMIQHTAAISPGNSGGPLVNDRGEVIGINTEQLRTGQNLNFALPVFYLRSALSGDLNVRGTVASYRSEIEKLRAKRVAAAFDKAFTTYKDPDGLFQVGIPRGWTVQRQVKADSETGGVDVTVMIHAPDAELAHLDGWLSAGMRFSLRLPPKDRVWTETYRKQWAESAIRSTVGSYDKVKTSDPEEAQLGKVKMVGFVVSGTYSKLSEPEVGGIFLLPSERALVQVEIAMPSGRTDTLKAITTLVAASLEMPWAQ